MPLAEVTSSSILLQLFAQGMLQHLLRQGFARTGEYSTLQYSTVVEYAKELVASYRVLCLIIVRLGRNLK
jgi:hypothetical protein